MKLLKLDDDVLMDYVDGKLDEESQRQIEKALERDPAIGARIAELAEARRTSGTKLREPLGQHELVDQVRAFASPPGDTERRQPPRRRLLPTIAALVAALLIVGLWFVLTAR